MGVRSLALRLLLVAIALPALCPMASAAAADPSALVTELGVQLRQVLGDNNLTLTERQQRFRTLLDASFDFPTISRFVLGPYWQGANDSFRQEFSGVFEDYVIQSLSGRFGEYSGESMKVTATRTEGERSTIVSTAIVHPNGALPAKVDWRVLNTSSGFKIADVSVSGISMALSYREQFAAMIDHDGGQVTALIPALRQKINGQATSSTAGNTQANGGRP
jgi:phospholipid transport system substrate-binding protein